MGDSDLSLYHGTTFNIPVGDRIRPGKRVGHTNWGQAGHHGQRSEEHAFATSNEGVAWHFAESARNHMATANYFHPDMSPAPDRVSVYRVAPNPQMRPGVFNRAHPDYEDGLGNLHEYVAPSFKTTERIDIKPGQQGTFPSLNWAQFRHPQMVTDTDVNHPSDAEIEGGHRAQIGTSARDKQIQKAQDAVVTPKTIKVSRDQMDLFTGKTSEEHARGWDDLAEYHSKKMVSKSKKPAPSRLEDL